MAYIPKKLRQQVTKRAKRRCEYCKARLDIVLYVEIDHVIPESAGGETTLENLCLACAPCNRAKQDAQIVIDPETGEEAPLFNPRTQSWSVHFSWSEGNYSACA